MQGIQGDFLPLLKNPKHLTIPHIVFYDFVLFLACAHLIKIVSLSAIKVFQQQSQLPPLLFCYF